MAISFNEIPLNLREPGVFVEIDNSNAVQGTPAQPHSVLIIGFRSSTGSVAANVLTLTLSETQAEDFFGVDSPLARMVGAYKAVDPLTEVWCIALDEATGTQATGSIAVTGAATGAGELAFYVGGRRYAASVAAGDTETEIGDAMAAAVTADPRSYVTAANATGTVTFTAKLDGTYGNDLDIRVNYYQGEQLPAGVTVSSVPMGSGATNPALDDTITALGDIQFHTVVTMFTADSELDDLEAMMDTRWGGMVMKEGHIFAAIADTVGSSTTAGNARNSKASTLVALQESPTPHWIGAAQAAARDAFQAQSDPARPCRTLSLPDVLAPAKEDRWTYAQRNTALTDGLATVDYGDNDDVCRISFLATTYQTNAGGTPDTSYHEVRAMRTLAYLRYSLRTRIALKYPRHKKAADGTLFGPGQPILTPSALRAEILALAREWEVAGLIENYTAFKDSLVVESAAGDPNRFNVRLNPNLINGFNVFAGQIQFAL